MLFLHAVHFLVGIGTPWFDWFDKRGPSTPISIDVWRAGRFIWKASLFNNYANDFVTACGFAPVSRGSGATAASRLGIRTSPGPTMALSDMHRGVEPGFLEMASRAALRKFWGVERCGASREEQSQVMPAWHEWRRRGVLEGQPSFCPAIVD